MQYPKLVWRFKESNDEINVIDVFSDSDCAGCRSLRRSTSGGVESLAGGGIKSWTSTQATVAILVGEEKDSALVRAAAE